MNSYRPAIQALSHGPCTLLVGRPQAVTIKQRAIALGDWGDPLSLPHDQVILDEFQKLDCNSPDALADFIRAFGCPGVDDKSTLRKPGLDPKTGERLPLTLDGHVVRRRLRTLQSCVQHWVLWKSDGDIRDAWQDWTSYTDEVHVKPGDAPDDYWERERQFLPMEAEHGAWYWMTMTMTSHLKPLAPYMQLFEVGEGDNELRPLGLGIDPPHVNGAITPASLETALAVQLATLIKLARPIKFCEHCDTPMTHKQPDDGHENVDRNNLRVASTLYCTKRCKQAAKDRRRPKPRRKAAG